MKVKKQTLNIIIIIWGIALVGFLFFIFTRNQTPSNNNVNSLDSGNSVSYSNGEQIINVSAKGGYFPESIEAKANQKTIIKISTKNTFDCGLAFTIPSLNIRKTLPPTGITDIEIQPQKPGSKLVGTCTMGMYRFVVNFI